MKKFYKYILLLLIALVLFGCGKGEESIVTFNINPSVEFVFDSRGRVGAITPYNEDASIVISDEDFVGLKAKDATEKYITLCMNLGYIKDDGSSQIDISVSGDSSYALKLQETIRESTIDTLDRLGVKATLSDILVFTEDKIDDLLLSMNYSNDQIAEMNLSEKIKTILEERVKTLSLPTYEMISLYYTMLSTRIDLVGFEVMQQALDGLSDIAKSLYAILSAAYIESVNQYLKCTNILVDTYNNYLVNDDSAYQIAFTELMAAKDDLINAKLELKNSIENSDEYQQLLLEIEEKEKLLNDKIDALSSAKEYALSMFSAAKSILEAGKNEFDVQFGRVYSALKAFVDNDEVAKGIAEKTIELNKTYIESFISIHKDNIEKMKSCFSTEKELLLK